VNGSLGVVSAGDGVRSGVGAQKAEEDKNKGGGL
jgi:hypothetical protein